MACGIRPSRTSHESGAGQTRPVRILTLSAHDSKDHRSRDHVQLGTTECRLAGSLDRSAARSAETRSLLNLPQELAVSHTGRTAFHVSDVLDSIAVS